MFRTRWLYLAAFCCVAGCTGNSAKPTSAGSADKPKVEGALAFTDLMQDEYDTLKIKTQAATIEEVQERLTLTGWITAKPGHEVTLTAPAAGYVRIAGASFPFAGDPVNPKQELLLLEPVLSPAEKIQADALERTIIADKKKAEQTLVAAKNDHDRTEKMYAQKDDKGNPLRLKSDQERDLALKAFQHAKEELDAAKAKLEFFKIPNRSITAPRHGIVLQVFVGDGQYVSAAAPLLTVIDLNPIWLRVPVPEVDLPVVDAKASIDIVGKNSKGDRGDKSAMLTGKPTQLATSPLRVAQVDPVKHTADLWYELEPSKEPFGFVKDQMVTVQVKVGRKENASVVPDSAIIYDAHGNTWVYIEQPAPKDGKHLFERRRIELVAPAGDGIIVRPTLTKGALVVTNGAAALFSREFHKTPVRAEVK